MVEGGGGVRPHAMSHPFQSHNLFLTRLWPSDIKKRNNDDENRGAPGCNVGSLTLHMFHEFRVSWRVDSSCKTGYIFDACLVHARYIQGV